MSQSNNSNSNSNNNTGNCKTKAVFTIIEDEKLDRPIFRRIGTGFVNRDQSLNIFLDALPVSGKLHLRDADKFEKTDGAQA